ncbi:hypothetical protein [Kitasatospora sp. NPDC098663]|uniref:hypothetical protein n=1 Tax=Kitasatospora sp. NPDC098663 TaxID=3364096 RepID=UPI00380B73AE
MAKISSRIRLIGAIVPKATAIGGLTVAAITVLAPAASAGGTSGTTNGCYATWGDTGANGHCTSPSATQTGLYSVYESCAAEPDSVSTQIIISKGQVVNNFGQVYCTFSANWAAIHFTTQGS